MQIQEFSDRLMELSKQPSNKLRIAGLTLLLKTLSSSELSAALFLLEPKNKTLMKLDLSTERLAFLIERHEGERLSLSWLNSRSAGGDTRTLEEFVQAVKALIPAMAEPVAARLARVATFLDRCSRTSGWLFVAVVTDELTIGLARQNVLRSLSSVFEVPLEPLRQACSADRDLFTLDFVRLKPLCPLTPFRPMLASLFKQPSAGEYLWQKKQDGFRVLIHWSDGIVKVFSRGQEDVTLTTEALIRRELNLDRNTILDGQIIHTGGFQEVTRIIRRKSGFQQFLGALRLAVFDILYHEHSLLERPYRERRALLQRLVPGLIPPSGPFIEAESALTHATRQGWEGVMIKDLAAPYVLGRRTKHWCKLKADFMELDVAIVGYEAAEGQKTGVGSFILGIRHGDLIKTIGKVGTGFTDQARRSLLQVVGKPQPTCTVKFQSISVSPKTQSGFALRFPVFVCIREDKRWSDIATYLEIKQLTL